MKVSLISVPVQDPIIAHEIYTTKLGFKSKRFDENSKIVIVESPEIEGRTKNKRRTAEIENSFLCLDSIEIGVRQKIPLYLFGFLY
jgi:hypothetical protein